MIKRAEYLSHHYCADIVPLGGMNLRVLGAQGQAYNAYALFSREFRDHNGHELRQQLTNDLELWLIDYLGEQHLHIDLDIARVEQDRVSNQPASFERDLRAAALGDDPRFQYGNEILRAFRLMTSLSQESYPQLYITSL